MALIDKSVTSDGDTWTFQCPGVRGDRCGAVDGPPFSSSGWPTKKAAVARGGQHFAEHKGEGPMQELGEFRNDQGLVVNRDGSVSVEDL